ncbi:hypothetical protein BKA93DRAFT_219783 [Sparassis latifolia]|uniref:Proteasome assembly chaperone 3 n=1 Tax=Sparassis crispa TaxID=139825 RepID=A0A401GJ76_9APHY|nr:hypothetical protein SCP_0405450 [Sparassis crispa]GBE82165.1 hypothetical protein SCP_0405450 [Sparassis crispa]
MPPSGQAFRVLDGIPTEVLLQTYADRTLVLVTQLGKVGNLIQATIPPTAPLLPAPPPNPLQPNVTPLPVPPTSIQLTPLLGNAPSDRLHTLYSLYASQIATVLWAEEAGNLLQGDRRGVVVGIALHKTAETEDDGLTEHEREVFHGVMDMVRDLLRRQ